MLAGLAQFITPNLPGADPLNLPGGAGGVQIQTPIVNVINWGLLVAGGVTILILVISAFFYITASGDEKRLERAKAGIRGAITGLIIMLIAAIIVNTIIYAITRNEGPDLRAQCVARGGDYECDEEGNCACFTVSIPDTTVGQ